jgi:hypothetical protein
VIRVLSVWNLPKRVCVKCIDVDGCMGVNGEEAGEICTRLDDKGVTGGGYDVVTEFASFQLESSKSFVLVVVGNW